MSPSLERARRRRLKRRAMLLLPVLLGGVLAAFRIEALSFWSDEAASWAIASPPLRQLAGGLWEEPNMALYYLLLRLWLLGGASEGWLRAFSGLAAVLGLWFAGPLAVRVAGRRVAMACVTLLATNPAWVTLAQEARGYALALALQIASAAALARATLDRERGQRWLYVSASLLGLALWAHALSAFAAVGLGAWATWPGSNRFPRRALFGPAALFAVMMLPLALRVAVGPETMPTGGPGLGLRPLFEATLYLTGRGRSAWLLLPLLGALIAAGGAALCRGGGAHPLRLLPLYWLLVQLAVLLLASVGGLHLIVWRYLAFLVPPFLLLAAAGLVGLRPLPRAAAVVVLTLATAATLRVHYFKEPKEDWRGASRAVLDAASPGDGVVVFNWASRPGFDFYAAREPRSRVEVLSLASGPLRFGGPAPPPDPAAVRTLAAGRPRVFLLLSHHCLLGRDVPARELLRLLAQSHRLVAHEQFYLVDLLRFERRAPGDTDGGLPPFDPCAT